MPHHLAAQSTLTFGSFFDSTGWQLFQNLSIFFVVAFWLASIWWVVRDARRRIEDPWIAGMAAMLALVPFLGALLYLVIRPLEPVADRQARELEIRALRRRLETGSYCPACGSETGPSFRFCPACAAEIRAACVGCETPLDPLWQNCPFCGTPTGAELERVADAPPTLVEVLKPQVSQSVSQ